MRSLNDMNDRELAILLIEEVRAIRKHLVPDTVTDTRAEVTIKASRPVVTKKR